MNNLQSTAHELLNLLIHKAAYTGKTDMMTITIPYSALMDHPDMEFKYKSRNNNKHRMGRR